VCVLASGCDKPKEASPPPGPATKAPVPAKPAVGLDHPANSPAVVAEIKKVLTNCDAKWKPDGFDSDCPAMKEYVDSKLYADGKEDATLLNVLEDPSEKTRFLATRQLFSIFARAYKKDKVLAARVLTAAQKEKSPAVVKLLGKAVAYIAAKETGLAPAIKKLALNPAVAQPVRNGVVAFFLNENSDDPVAYEMTKEVLAKEKDKDLRLAAIRALSSAESAHAEEVCKLWSDLLKDPEPDVVMNATARLTRGSSGVWFDGTSSSGGGGLSKCTPAQQEAALAAVEAVAKAGKINDSDWLDAFRTFSDDDAKAQPWVKGLVKKIVAGLQTVIANDKNGSGQRGRALRRLAEVDLKLAKGVAKKYLKDKDLKDDAEAVSKQEPPKK
jgi:hypothetical protein